MSGVNYFPGVKYKLEGLFAVKLDGQIFDRCGKLIFWSNEVDFE